MYCLSDAARSLIGFTNKAGKNLQVDIRPQVKWSPTYSSFVKFAVMGMQTLGYISYCKLDINPVDLQWLDCLVLT